MRSPTVLLALATLIASTSPGLGAQVIDGQVADGETFEVIEGASITLVHPDGHDLADPVQSSASGRFSVPVPGPGSYYLRFERLGYTDITEGVFEFGTNEGRLAVEVFLRRAPVELEGIEVTGDQARVRRSLRAAGYYERATSGFGDFITPEEIEARGFVPNVSDYLWKIPGVATYSSLIVFRHNGGAGGLIRIYDDAPPEVLNFCEPNVWVDGIQMTKASKPAQRVPPEIKALVGPAPRELRDGDVSMGIDDALTANDIVAIEVYRSAATTPLQWGGLDTGCGTIVIWTKQGR